MQLKSFFLSVFVFAVLFNSALADGVFREVKFKKGESSATIEGAVIRGERDTYTLGAKAGQTMSVSITSVEDNAVFEIYGEVEGDWVALHGADEGDDATEWEDTLPGGGSGRYKIVVGATRGNASYDLEIAIE
jgi:hypothetical protein